MNLPHLDARHFEELQLDKSKKIEPTLALVKRYMDTLKIRPEFALAAPGVYAKLMSDPEILKDYRMVNMDAQFHGCMCIMAGPCPIVMDVWRKDGQIDFFPSMMSLSNLDFVAL